MIELSYKLNSHTVSGDTEAHGARGTNNRHAQAIRRRIRVTFLLFPVSPLHSNKSLPFERAVPNLFHFIRMILLVRVI